MLHKSTDIFNLCKISALFFSKPRSVSSINSFLRNPFRTSRSFGNQRKNKIISESYDKAKAKLILELNFKSAEDALPFYKLPFKTIIHISKCTFNDNKLGYCKNRLYYISDEIKCSSAILSPRLAQRSFVYSLSFDWLKKSLQALLEIGVSGKYIIRDLWVLKYHHETIKERLQRVKDLDIEILHPWMVRCSEDILNRFIILSQETKNILGDTKSTQIYLANRLNTTTEVIQDMYKKSPALKTIRVTKVKPFLDFLLNEGFEAHDIISKPRILSASQKTVEQRLFMLRKLGIHEINLNVLCRSRKDFKKYCETIDSEDLTNVK